MIGDGEAPNETAHQIGRDSWYQVALLLATGMNSAYVLAFSYLIMVPLGWIGGTVGLILVVVFSLYANILMAELHETGGKRQIRYRDLAGHVYGKRMYFITWCLQYVNLFMLSTGFILVAGQALKATYALYRDDRALKLPYCIVIVGFFFALFALGVPHLSALRIWLCFSGVFSLIYMIIAVVLSAKDGINAPRRDYSIPGTTTDKFLGVIGAIATLIFGTSASNVPEIQATLKAPAVKNMKTALWLQYTAGILPFCAVIYTGYWAFGSSTPSYLLNSVSGPRWVLTLANVATILQSIISLHVASTFHLAVNILSCSFLFLFLQIFASPTYEYIDTKYGKSGPAFSIKNLSFRVMTRGGYVILNTLVAAALPFLGDFTNLAAALSTIPLVLVLGNHMYMTVKKNKISIFQKSWHWFNAVMFSLFAVLAAVAAIRFIALHVETYHIFADV